MYVIDRTIAIIRPKKPFMDWLKSTDPDFPFDMERAGRERVTFLMPRYVTKDDAEEALKHLYSDIFAVQLSTGCTNESQWPEDRGYEKFREWFDVEFHSMVLDPFEDEIRKEPYEYVSTEHMPPGGGG
jgi:hypothetical protein